MVVFSASDVDGHILRMFISLLGQVDTNIFQCSTKRKGKINIHGNPNRFCILLVL